MKNHVITTTILVGKRLLAKARIETATEATEVTGVVMGDTEQAEPLACLAALYSAHLFAPTAELEQAIKEVVHLLDPNAEMVVNERKPVIQPPLVAPEDDLPF
jgi:hypothetical protein